METEGWQEIVPQLVMVLKGEGDSPVRLLLERGLQRMARGADTSAGLVILEGEEGRPEVVCRLGPSAEEGRLSAFWSRLRALGRPACFSDPRIWEDPALPTTLFLPLRQQAHFLGALVLGLAAPLSEEEQGRLAEESGEVVLFLELEAERRRAARRLRESEALLQISRALSRPASMEEMLGLIIQAVVENIPAAEAGVIHLLGEDEILVPMGAFHTFLSRNSRVRMRLGVGLAGTALLEGQTVRVDDVTADPRFLPGHAPPAYRSLLIAPMEMGGRKVGTLSLQSSRIAAFTPEDARFLSILAGQAAMIVENGRLLAELRRRLEELRQAQAYLVRSEKLAATGRLAASVAHEINNPLEGIKNFLALLARRLPPDDPNQELVRLLEVGFERIHTTVRRMLSFSRAEEAAKHPCDLREVVENALSLLRNRLLAEHIEIRLELPDGLPHVLASPPQIEQALVSLFLNAADAMAGKGGLLEIRGWQDGERVRLAIRDTGPGIPEEIRERLFEPFITTKRNGSGMGLELLRHITEHGGTIEVESERGRGTTFIIALPALSTGASDT
ncbi:MAG: ATP-binding protein [Chloroflexia bacterium]